MGMFDDVLSKVGEPYTGGGKGFKYGTHEVVIGMVEPGQKKLKNNSDAAVINVDVYDPADPDRIGHATLYFHTEGGAQMSVAKVLGLMVHNVGEDKKDVVRDLGKKLFANIDDPTKARDVAAKLMLEKFVQKNKEYKGYFFADPTGKYDTTSYGDLWHYQYEDPDADDKADAKAAAEIKEAGEPVADTDLADIPGFEDL